MNRNFFNLYQYIAFLVLFPVAFFLWYRELFNLKMTVITLGLPILTSYIIPLIGTNVTKFWEFNIKNKVNNIRPYHGFVFGSATGLIGLLFHKISFCYLGVGHSLTFAFVSAAFIAFWNTLYDAKAVECGYIKINNLASKSAKSPLESVCDYAPSYFYIFGFIYCLFIKFIQFSIVNNNPLFWFEAAAFYLAALILPTLGYMILHYLKYGSWGFWGEKDE